MIPRLPRLLVTNDSNGTLCISQAFLNLPHNRYFARSIPRAPRDRRGLVMSNESLVDCLLAPVGPVHRPLSTGWCASREPPVDIRSDVVSAAETERDANG